MPGKCVCVYNGSGFVAAPLLIVVTCVGGGRDSYLVTVYVCRWDSGGSGHSRSVQCHPIVVVP